MKARLLEIACTGALALGWSFDPASSSSTLSPAHVQLSVHDRVVATVDPRFVSFSLDAAQVVGGLFWDPEGAPAFGFGSHRRAPFDFERPKLLALTEALGPAYLRIGGSEADRIYYDLDDKLRAPPEGYEEILTGKQWDAVGQFARRLNLRLAFTLNAGPASRPDGHWDPTQAERLITYTRAQNYPVSVWELGNEVNGYAALFGPFDRVSGETYAQDLIAAKKLIARVMPEARLSGPSSAFFPLVGEVFGILQDTLEAGGGNPLDIMAWHYYPMQSGRCPVASRRASLDHNFDPESLDEIVGWAEEVESLRDAWAADVPIWLGETGNAQCGGAAGLSDRFAGTFWWLDELGLLARRGHQVVVRQTLTGADYGLLDEQTLDPRPDYWATLLFKRLMGTSVLDVTPDPRYSRLRAYAHCRPEGGVSLLAINLDRHRAAILDRGGLPEGPVVRWALTADALDAKTVSLNHRPLTFQNERPELAGQPAKGPLKLAPASLAFFEFPQAQSAVCSAR